MYAQLGKIMIKVGREATKQAPKIGKAILKIFKSKAAREVGKKIATDMAIMVASAAAQKMVEKISDKNTNMTLSKRLKELDKLKEKGKLSSAEYKRLRRKIIEIS